MKIVVVIGARPQFIKHAPFEIACKGKIELILIHTGQHFDSNMSEVFFNELGMSKPHYLLQTGGGNHGAQTGLMLQEIEPIVLKENPDCILVYGDTNSTLAGALVGSKLHIPIIHIEAGLRSFNKDMPEEINRILTDHVSEMLFTSTSSAILNLKKEGITENVFLLGDIMADSVNLARTVNEKKSRPLEEPYYFVTVHRPYNTDKKERLIELLTILNDLDKKVVFPIHPRTRNLAKTFEIELLTFKNIIFLEPLSYFENIQYLTYSDHAITDSGGLQKEAYILQTPCITVRSETEWIETMEESWNVLCFNNLLEIPDLLNRKLGEHNPLLYGDGKSSENIVETILNKYSN